MCLIFIAHRQHPDYPLIIAANRDEFYDRPSEVMHFQQQGNLLAGKDLKAGGTWLGLNRKGRFAAVTNYREAQPEQAPELSRGHIPMGFLHSNLPAEDYAEQLRQDQHQYAGFNLVFGSLKPPFSLYHLSNRSTTVSPLKDGLFGLSNALLDSHWPKIDQARPRIRALLQKPPEPEDWFFMLADRNMASIPELPDTGIGQQKEQLMSPRFIHTYSYGTRSSTVLFISHDHQAYVYERSYNRDAEPESTQRFHMVFDQ